MQCTDKSGIKRPCCPKGKKVTRSTILGLYLGSGREFWEKTIVTHEVCPASYSAPLLHCAGDLAQAMTIQEVRAELLVTGSTRGRIAKKLLIDHWRFMLAGTSRTGKTKEYIYLHELLLNLL